MSVKVKKKDDAGVNAYVPKKSISKQYVSRKLTGGVDDMVLADMAALNDENILLFGNTGSGKTIFGEAFAAKQGRLYYSVPCNIGVDPMSMFGKLTPTDEVGKFEWQDGPVTEIVRGPCGRGSECVDDDCIGGVLNISEINMMSPKIAASLYPLLDARRYLPLLGHGGEIVGCHPNTLIIADINPNYRGTQELNEAFANRFTYRIPWEYDNAVESKLVQSAELLTLAWKLRRMFGTEIVTPISTNMLMTLESIAQTPELGAEFAFMNFCSSFKHNERESVTSVLELHKSKIKNDLLGGDEDANKVTAPEPSNSPLETWTFDWRDTY